MRSLFSISLRVFYYLSIIEHISEVSSFTATFEVNVILSHFVIIMKNVHFTKLFRLPVGKWTKNSEFDVLSSRKRLPRPK